MLKNTKELPTVSIVKGKSVAIEAPSVRSYIIRKEKPPDVPWKPPPPGWVKLTVDGSFNPEDGAAGAGMILRDVNGHIIFSACRNLLMCEGPLEAEARACLEGLELALQHSHLPIIIDTDCVQLISMVQGTSPDRSPLMHLFMELKSLASLERICSFVKVDHSQVRVSHCLANFARVEFQTSVWFGTGPDSTGTGMRAICNPF
jgi:ribonuclease HI